MKINYEWDEESGVASCIIEYHGKPFLGMAICHPDDSDMKSHLIGQTIAEWRARIHTLEYIRDSEVKERIAALKQFYYSINKSKHFQEKSYENKMLQRQIRNLENDLTTVKQELIDAKKNLRDYIMEKELYHFKLRIRPKK